MSPWLDFLPNSNKKVHLFIRNFVFHEIGFFNIQISVSLSNSFG